MNVRDVLDNIGDELNRALDYLKDLLNNGVIEGDDTLNDLIYDIEKSTERLPEVQFHLESCGVIDDDVEVE